MRGLTREDLLRAGYPAEPVLDLLLRRVSEYVERGITDPKYQLKLLKRDVGPPAPKGLRMNPAPLREAVEGRTTEELGNVAATRRRMSGILRSPVIVRGAMLPDACPAGPGEFSMPVGGAVEADNAIIPSAHSSDICCSMLATFYVERDDVSKELDALTRVTRFGPGPRPADELVEDPVTDEEVWENRFLQGLRERAIFHMADQGDGNHFAFIGEMTVGAPMLAMLRLTGHGDLAAKLGEAGTRYRVLVTHHGSRGLGAHVFKRGQVAAVKHVARSGWEIPNDLAWLDARTDTGRDYWHALEYVARWTKANHRAIHRRFLDGIGGVGVAEVGNEHNFVWQRGDSFFHGKGATPAWRDGDGRPRLGLIPLNMSEPILLVLGGDRDDFLSFAPHGAGRNLSRTALRKTLRGNGVRSRAIGDGTRNIDVRWFLGNPDFGELPLAYKSADWIKDQIRTFGLAEVVAEIRPLGCIMAGNSGRDWKTREEELTPKQLRQIGHRAERRKMKQKFWRDPGREED